jgi:hypothetical protein
MAHLKSIQQQLKAIKFGNSPWNQAEIRELPKIIHDNEKISECVNGYYEGGFALLVATEMRLLLIDKKPLNYLTVEDLRFDMINEIDYSHRLMGATITISTGSKTLKFKSYNQPRLRHLIELVQQHMSDGKKEQSEKAEHQQQHLEEINKQLQMYLLAQHQQLQMQVNSTPPQAAAAPVSLPGSIKPNPQLSDYLFAQRLLEQFQRDNNGNNQQIQLQPPAQPAAQAAPLQPEVTPSDIVAEAKREVFGSDQVPAPIKSEPENPANFFTGLEINPLRIAYSKLPMMLRNRKFGRPSLRDHSEQPSAIPAAAQIVPS